MENSENLQKIRHSLAHLLASAIMEFFPKTKLGIGPAIENGFYYDMELAKNFTPEDLEKIENRMRQLIKENQTFIGKKVSKLVAKKLFNDQPYKLDLIKELPGKIVGTYQNGAFLDLCKGGHVDNTNSIDPNSFKLTKIAGAYWKGDEKNNMLTRIYGVAFATAKELQDYVVTQAEAEKRDHRILGQKLDLFVFSDLVGPGLPLYTFKGTTVLKEIKNYSNQLQETIGYRQVQTPNMNRAELFKISGHYEKYKDDMFKVASHYSKEDYYLKPMNCPQHTQIFASQARSYKDLPIRISDFANLYRDEKTGELAGLTRLRAFSQDDGHCFCTEAQIKDEFTSVLLAIQKAMKTYGMDYKIRLSLWDPKKPENYLGDKKTWAKSQQTLEEVLVQHNITFEKAEGEAAFYGPKMDLICKDSIGRQWQLGTIQLDFIMPGRFGLTYTDSDGTEKMPIMIHRALVGSPERFFGILIEHYAGAFPLWLSPIQIAIIPISAEKHLEYAKQVAEKFQTTGFRFEVVAENETLGKKIREAEMQKVPYLLIIGDKEIAAGAVGVRQRGKGDLGAMPIDAFIEKINQEIKDKK